MKLSLMPMLNRDDNMGLKIYCRVVMMAALSIVSIAGNPALAGPQVLSRAQWGAKPPSKPMTAQKPAYITIHHSAVTQRKGDLARKMKNLQRFSQKRERLASGKMKVAWADVPYHFVINAAGQIAEGRNINFSGDTNTNYNPVHHIQVVLEGNFMKEQVTTAQLRKLEELLVSLARKWKIPASKIEGHKHYASTLCPGTNLFKEIPALRQRIAKRLGK